MNRIEKLRFYATAPRASAKQVHKIVDGDFVPFWLASLRGQAVAIKASEQSFKSRDEAVQHARYFRDSCRQELAELERTGGNDG